MTGRLPSGRAAQAHPGAGEQTNPAAERAAERARERGETVIGSAFLFSIVLFAIFLLIQILLGYYVRSVASFAASDAAALMARDGATEAEGEAYATTFILSQAGGLVIGNDLVVRADKGAEETTVTVTGRTRLLWSVGLDVEGSAPTERFEPQR